MNIEVIVNNYSLGAKVKTTPTHKLVSQERLDSKHTKLTYSDVTQREKEFIEKVLSYKAYIVG